MNHSEITFARYEYRYLSSRAIYIHRSMILFREFIDTHINVHVSQLYSKDARLNFLNVLHPAVQLEFECLHVCIQV